MLRLTKLLCLAAIVTCTQTQSARADLLQGVLSVPRRIVSRVDRVTPMVDLSTAIPTAREVRQFPMVPRPGNGRILRYPGRVVRYGLNVYPTARVIRRNLFIGR